MEHQIALRALEVMSVALLLHYCLNEARGQGPLPYSKFAPPTSQHRGGSGKEERKKEEDRRDDEQPSLGGSTSRSIPSQRAMFIAYFPSLLLSSSFLAAKLHVLPLPPPAAAAASSSFLAFFEATDLRITVLAAAVAFHFLKRVLEVLFLHKYSGTMELSLSITISSFYLFSSTTLLYAQQVAATMHQPFSLNLMWYGLFVYMVGIMGNFYHHCILASLRKSSSKESHQYVIPKGGLFSILVCPHYLFESIDFLGLAMIGQTTMAFLLALCVTTSLAFRSHSTKLWYTKKIEGFPKDRKVFLPFMI